MTRFLTLCLLCLLALLFTVPTQANYGYYNSYSGYGNYGSRFYYYPTYHYPTLPTYSYYSTPSYYNYAAPNYNVTNYYDGNYHYHEAGSYAGVWYPAGYYAWRGGTWVAYSPTQAQQYTPTPPPNWKEQILKVAEKRDEYNAYINALKALGLAPPPVGFTPPPGVSYSYTNRNANLGTYGSNGTSIYSYSSIKDLYGDANLSSLFQQAQQLAQNAQQLSGDATQQFQSAITNEGNNRAKVAEILAKGQADAEKLRAVRSESRSESRTTVIQGGSQQGPAPQPVPRPSGLPPEEPAFTTLYTRSCLKCHGGEKIEGKFDVTKYHALSLKDKAEKVWPRLTTADADQRMPRNLPPLTPEELLLFFKN